MTKTKALKNFINKFLGYEATGNSVTSVLTDTTENAEGGGSGGSIFAVHITAMVDPNSQYVDPNTGDMGDYLSDKTFDEMKDAYDSEKVIMLYVQCKNGSGPHDVVIPVAFNSYLSGIFMADFMVPSVTKNEMYYIKCTMSTSGDNKQWTFARTKLALA